MASAITSSGPAKREGSSDPATEPEFGRSKVPSEGEVSGSGDLGTQTYLVLNIWGGVVGGRFFDYRHEVGARWVINFPLVGLEPDLIIVC